MRLYLFSILFFTSFFSFAQIETVENFNGASSAPPGWSTAGWLLTTANQTCSQTTNLQAIMNNNVAKEVTTPYQVDISNGTDLSINFDLKVANWSFFGGETPVEDGWGYLNVEYTTDSITWVLLDSLSSDNFVSILECETWNYTVLGADIPIGADFQFRFRSNHLDGQYFVYLDNFNIYQTATVIPNCDAQLSSPMNGDTLIEVDASINWTSSTGLPSGYKISMGTTSGGVEIADAVDVGNLNTYIPSVDLEYNTLYYVTIVSYNSFGDALSCEEQTFTTRDEPLAGSSCINPIVISSFPFENAGGIEEYDNNYQTSECNNTYISGYEVVYSYTPIEQSSINIRFDSLVGNRTAIHVLDGCPDEPFLNCLAYFGSFNPADQYFENLILEAGHTYYIVVASSSETSLFTYHLEVTKNPCVIPDAVLVDSMDCNNGQYFVKVDVTRFGNGTSLTIEDDQGNPSQQVTTTGEGSAFGPYATGTPVSFSIANDQNSECTITREIEFHCPPLNDDCIDAIALETNADLTCTNFVSGSLQAASFSVDDISACEFSLVKDVWYSFEATNSIHTIELSNVVAVVGNSTIVQYEVLEGTCGGGLTSLLCSNYKYNNIGSLTIGNTYYVRVLNTSVSAVTFDLCVSTPVDVPANDVCSGAVELLVSTDNLCDNLLTGSTSSAFHSDDNTCIGSYNEVWFSFTPEKTGYYTTDLEVTSGSATTGMSFWSGVCGDLTVESDCGISDSMSNYAKAGQTYYVMVRSRSGEPGVDFTLCSYQIFPPANNECSSASNFMESTDETGNNLVVGTNNGATNSPTACYSGSYEGVWYAFTPQFTGEYVFDFTNVAGSGRYSIFEENCDDLTYVSGVTSCYTSGDKTIDVVAGTSYKVSMHSSEPFVFEFFVYPKIASPANDICEAAIVLTESDDNTCNNMVTGTTISASASDNICSGENYNVWYSFVPNNIGYYHFDISGDANLSLYSGNCDTLIQESLICENSSLTQLMHTDSTYFVLVSSSSTNNIAGVDFTLCAYQVMIDANNECADAETFVESMDNTGENTVTGSLMNATYSSEACYETSYQGVWYTFTANYSGEYVFDFSGDASYAIYAGNCDDATAITANCYNSSSSNINVLAGETYLVSVHAESAASYDFFVYPNLTAPSNSECNTAEILIESSDATCNNIISGTTIGATHSTDNICDADGADVWYTFTPTATGAYQFSLNQTSTGGASSISLFSGECGALIMESADCSDSLLENLTGGTTYTLIVTSDNTVLGVDFEVCVFRSIVLPSNDECADATTFDESDDNTGNNLVIGNTQDATNSDEGCYANSYEGVWYEFTTLFAGTYTVEFTGLAGDPAYTVYSGDCSTLAFAEGIESNCYNTGTTVISAELGETFTISVHSEDAAAFELFAYHNVVDGNEELTQNSGLKYYPNPIGTDILTFEADFAIASISIMNALGQKVINEYPNAKSHTIDVVRLDAGIYFVEVDIDGSTEIIKVIKE